MDVIDYRPQYTERSLSLPFVSTIGLRKNLGALYVLIFEKKRRELKINRFLEFIDKINVSDKIYISPRSLSAETWAKYDLLISGSDQLWNPYIVGDDLTYLLPFDHKNKLSYASSFGITDFPESFTDAYGQYLRQFKTVLTREEQGERLLSEIWGIKAETVLDPTLMLNNSEWNEYAAETNPLPESGYILTYYMIPTQLCFMITERLRSLTKLPVVNLKPTKRQVILSSDINMIDAGPAEFLQCYKNASYVVTNSFHGMAFAVNYNIPFYVAELPIRTKSLNSRLVNLLKQLKQQSRWIEKKEELSKVRTGPLDESVCSQLVMLRERSEILLINAVERKLDK